MRYPLEAEFSLVPQLMNLCFLLVLGRQVSWTLNHYAVNVDTDKGIPWDPWS